MLGRIRHSQTYPFPGCNAGTLDHTSLWTLYNKLKIKGNKSSCLNTRMPSINASKILECIAFFQKSFGKLIHVVLVQPDTLFDL